MDEVPEADWKVCRELRELAVERFADECSKTSNSFSGTCRGIIISITSMSIGSSGSETRCSRTSLTIRGEAV